MKKKLILVVPLHKPTETSETQVAYRCKLDKKRRNLMEVKDRGFGKKKSELLKRKSLIFKPIIAGKQKTKKRELSIQCY